MRAHGSSPVRAIFLCGSRDALRHRCGARRNAKSVEDVGHMPVNRVLAPLHQAGNLLVRHALRHELQNSPLRTGQNAVGNRRSGSTRCMIRSLRLDQKQFESLDSMRAPYGQVDEGNSRSGHEVLDLATDHDFARVRNDADPGCQIQSGSLPGFAVVTTLADMYADAHFAAMTFSL